MKRLTLLTGLFCFLLSPNTFAQVGKDLAYLPLQDSGRVKPFDTFARETLQMVWGKRSYNGKPAVDVVMTWMLIPEHWDETQFIQIQHAGVRTALQLENKRIHFAPTELLRNPRIGIVLQELRNLRERKEKLNPYYQAVQRLENQITIYNAIRNGLALRVWPQADVQLPWKSVAELEGESAELFNEMTKAFVAAVSTEKVADVKAPLKKFVSMARAQSSIYPSDLRIQLEVHYNKFHPLMWAWIMYMLSAVAIVVGLVSSKDKWSQGANVLIALGFLLHTYGIALRVYLAERPPVTNMYETVVWVAWGAIVFAAILVWQKKSQLLLLCATLVAVLCLILTDLAPTVLSSDISPLEPVLRSTFWLSTHVLMIVISYAAFFLAFALGDLGLFYFLRDEKKYAQQIGEIVHGIYRSIQIGVVLLAAGTILGGIWADYSWGRFWGWDPKETWALIALLGYLAILHGRISGWLKQFGMIAGAVVAFSLVIMAWYGVNFVLGAGLHSYGFGAGGVEYVSAFVGFHFLYVVYVAALRLSRSRQP